MSIFTKISILFLVSLLMMLKIALDSNSDLNLFIFLDIFVLVLIFLIVLKILYPIKELSKNLKEFAKGNYSIRLNLKSSDEIGDLAQTFNLMADKIEHLITSKERLLRNISHEIRTPISKGRLASEMIEESKYKIVIQKAFANLDSMTNDILNMERLNKESKLNITEFEIESLIAEALSQLFIDDEKLLNIEIENNHKLKADLNYLSIALKNLIDNALKYTSSYPIYIYSCDKYIYIKSRGLKLPKKLSFYLEEFNRDSTSRSRDGYGLGLSIVKNIVEIHDFKLNYYFRDEFNYFEIEYN